MTKTFLISIYGILTLLLVNSVQPLLTVGSDAETVILAENDTDSEEDTKKSLDDVYLSENFMESVLLELYGLRNSVFSMHQRYDKVTTPPPDFV